MNVLIIGAGGREHALGWKLKQSPKCGRLFFAPGNGGTAELGQNVPIQVDQVDTKTVDAIDYFCRQEKIRESAFYYWRRAIRERDEEEKSTSKTPPFVPAVVTDTLDRDTSIAIELVNGQVVRLPATMSASWIAELIDALDARGKR